MCNITALSWSMGPLKRRQNAEVHMSAMWGRGVASLAWLVPRTQPVILKLRKRARNPMSPKEYDCILIRDGGGYQYN